MKRTTIFLPEELHEQLRQDAFRNKISMAELIRAKLQQGLDRPPGASPHEPVSPDPILKVAGICRGAVLTSEIDDALYGG